MDEFWTLSNHGSYSLANQLFCKVLPQSFTDATDGIQLKHDLDVLRIRTRSDKQTQTSAPCFRSFDLCFRSRVDGAINCHTLDRPRNETSQCHSPLSFQLKETCTNTRAKAKSWYPFLREEPGFLPLVGPRNDRSLIKQHILRRASFCVPFHHPLAWFVGTA